MLVFAILTANWFEDGVRSTYDELKQCSYGAPCMKAMQAYRQECLCLHTSIDCVCSCIMRYRSGCLFDLVCRLKASMHGRRGGRWVG